MESPRSISDLIDAAGSSCVACRELLDRHDECHDHVDGIIDLLQISDAAISDFAFRILQRIGEPAVDPLISAFEVSHGNLRCLLMGLVTQIAPFDRYFPLLKSEIHHGSDECRYWAANCLGRAYDEHLDWPPEAMELLSEATDILQSLRDQPEQWVQARMTLKHLGKL